jgi:hydroxymethylpyrimidine pyrophosphatase-like HAD family hydrolase
LNASIGRWMTANEPYIERVVPIERALEGEAPIQMMLCGTVERMRRAEARLREHPGVIGVGVSAEGRSAGSEVALHRTEYADRNLSIVDILPAGCSKGAALLRLAEDRGVAAEEIMAIGDNWNDVSMLEVAGRAVLMGNAPEDLKAMAAAKGWVVGRRHDEDGVAEAIEAALAGRLEIPLPRSLSVTR